MIKLNTLYKNIPQCSKIAKQLNLPSIHAWQHVKHTSNTNTIQNNEVINDWEPIYRLKSINFFVGINKLKVYQAILTTTSIPLSMALEASTIIDPGSTVICAIIGITGTITLTLYSALSTNLIGFVYQNSTNTSLIRFSHINFWGKRKNIELNLNDIQTDASHLKFCAYLPVTVGKETYKLLPRFGNVSDQKAFVNIFGEF